MIIYTSLKNKWRRKTRATRTAIKLTILAECVMTLFLYLGYREAYFDLLKINQVSADINYPATTTPAPMPQTIVDTINYVARLYGVEPKIIIKLAQCESSGDPTRIGNEPKLNTNSIGLLQFQQATWARYISIYKMRNANIYDYRDQVILASQMIRDGHLNEWACANK